MEIDGIINGDRLILDRMYIQSKKWKETVVGRPEIQKFVGTLVGLGVATQQVYEIKRVDTDYIEE
ncbi:MAG: restriction endonuclease [Fervidobacterium sp.]